MVALLDVNVLIALVDPRHVHHESAHRWFAEHQQHGWATCPITQNAVLRVLGHARYPNGPGSPAAVLPLLEALIAHPRHVFWRDAISLVGPGLLNHQALLDSGQITDLYLLAMAVHHQGRLVTFDRRLRPDAVAGGDEALCCLMP